MLFYQFIPPSLFPTVSPAVSVLCVCQFIPPSLSPAVFTHCVCSLCLCFHWSEVKLLSHVWLFETLWTVAYQAPPSMRFSKQEYWSGLPFPSPGELPNPGIEPGSAALQADSSQSAPPGKPVATPLLLLLFSHSVVSDSLQSHGLQHARLHSPSPSPRAFSNSCPLSQWCHLTI